MCSEKVSLARYRSGFTQPMRLFLRPETALLLMNVSRTETPLCSWRRRWRRMRRWWWGREGGAGRNRCVLFSSTLICSMSVPSDCLTFLLSFPLPLFMSPGHRPTPSQNPETLSRSFPRPVSMFLFCISFIYENTIKWRLIFYISHVSGCLYFVSFAQLVSELRRLYWEVIIWFHQFLNIIYRF